MSYNMSAFTNSSNVFESFNAINVATEGILAQMVLVAIFVIFTFILMRRAPPAESIVASSGASMILSLIMVAMEEVSVLYVVGFSIIMAIGMISLYLNR